MLVRRMMRPMRVRRGSLRILNNGPSASFCASSRDFSASAPSRIERSLYSLNGLPCLPTRVCAKIGEPGDSSRTRMAANAMIGALTSSANAAPMKSNTRFTG